MKTHKKDTLTCVFIREYHKAELTNLLENKGCSICVFKKRAFCLLTNLVFIQRKER